MSQHIVFIHGLFQNPKSWQQWVTFFESRGYICHAPAYPYHEGEPSELRRHINPALGKLTLGQVVEHLSRFINTLPEKPILVGHSMGGLIVQKLIGMNKGSAGVCIDSAPPRGLVSFQWSFLRANLATVNPLKGNTPCLPSVEWFQYAFCNTMTLAETQKEYDAYVVPESRNIPRSSTGRDGTIDFRAPHVPLLFIAGEKDQIIPHSLNRKNFAAYTDALSVKEFVVFSDRTHYICGQRNWEEVAQYIEQWAQLTLSQPSI